MSTHVVSWVLKHSDATLGRRLVLLALADHANADGTGAWPSVATLAEEARLSKRATQDALRRLEADGHIVANGKSQYGTVVYDIPLGGVQNLHGGVQITTPHVSQSAPKPSLEPTSLANAREASEIPDADVLRLCNLLADLIAEDGVKRPTVTERWTTACRLLLDKDLDHPSRTRIENAAGVERVIRWCQADQFWRSNVLSMPKLREKWPTLVKQMRRNADDGGLAERTARRLAQIEGRAA